MAQKPAQEKSRGYVRDSCDEIVTGEASRQDSRMQLRQIQHGPLKIEELRLDADAAFCVVGTNGSGKSILGRLLAGKESAQSGEVELSKSAGLVSFEESQVRYERELARDDTDFSDQLDYGTTGLQLLLESGSSLHAAEQLAHDLGVDHLLSRGCRQFSTGEWRRLELARELLTAPQLLVLDEPFESLDEKTRAQLQQLLLAVQERGTQLVLLVNRPDDVPAWCGKVAVLHGGRVLSYGEREQTLKQPELRHLFFQEQKGEVPVPPIKPATRYSPVIDGRGLSVRYGDIVQFAPFDWRVEPGQHTRVQGPNGCGKSTLLGLLTGDHPQCYSNKLEVVGFRRGSGESIWDVKQRIGYVSPALHRDYRAPATALTAVCSGFFDSIGLYQQVTKDQLRLARMWLEIFALGSCADQPLRELSFGQQRLVLTARALVKSPPLLILDEPTAGLDALNAALVLRYFAKVAELSSSTVLFVSHRAEEHIVGIEHDLSFIACDDVASTEEAPRARYRVEVGRVGAV